MQGYEELKRLNREFLAVASAKGSKGDFRVHCDIPSDVFLNIGQLTQDQKDRISDLRLMSFHLIESDKPDVKQNPKIVRLVEDYLLFVRDFYKSLPEGEAIMALKLPKPECERIANLSAPEIRELAKGGKYRLVYEYGKVTFQYLINTKLPELNHVVAVCSESRRTYVS